jgi:putative glycosyltransferase
VELSIVASLYRSAAHLREFHARAVAAARALGRDFEIVLVNDGSPDDSLAIARELQAADPRTVIVDLSRNFGHHRAMLTGLAHARGDRIFLIDCDLEEPPELLQEFDTCMTANDCDMVYGVQEQRRGGWFQRVSGDAHYRLFNLLSSVPMPRNIITARLISRRMVQALLQYGEQVGWMDGLFALAGFRQVGLPVVKGSESESTYTLRRKLKLFVDAVTDFSEVPLHLIFYAGFVISLLSGCYITYLIFQKLYFGISVDGWTSVIVSLWFLGGMTILFLGIIGIYLSKIFIETKRRPLTVVRQVYRHGE